MQVDADKTRGRQAMGLPYFLLFAGGYAMALASLAPVMLVLAVALYGAGLYLRKHAVPIKNGMPDIGPQVENVQRFMRSVLTRVEPSAQPKPSAQPEAPAHPGPLVWQDCPAGGDRICIDGLCAGFTRNDIQRLYEELGRNGKTSAGYALGLRHQKIEFAKMPEGAHVHNAALLALLKRSTGYAAMRCERFSLRTSKGVAQLQGVLIRPKLSSHMHLAVIFLQKGGRGVLHVFTVLMPTAQMEKFEAIGIATNGSADLCRAESEVITQAERAVRTLLGRG